MNTGEIYVWITNQARGYETRKKYHVYLCEAGWRQSGHAFLFISSSDYGGDYPISNDSYPIFPLLTSYVGCNNLVFYDDEELRDAAPEKVGQLQAQHMRELLMYIDSSETMEGWQIKLACDAIRTVCQNSD